MTDDLRARADEIKQRKAEIIHQARQQAREILDSANARIENTIREIRSSQAEKEKLRKYAVSLKIIVAKCNNRTIKATTTAY